VLCCSDPKMGRNGSLERAREFTVLGPRVKTGRMANFKETVLVSLKNRMTAPVVKSAADEDRLPYTDCGTTSAKARWKRPTWGTGIIGFEEDWADAGLRAISRECPRR